MDKMNHCFRHPWRRTPISHLRCLGTSTRGEVITEGDVAAFKARIRSIGPGSVSILKDESCGLACITLHNAERRNALSGTMMVQLAEKVVELEHWERGVAVTLRGEGGRALCAGADLQLAREHLKTAEDGQLMCRLMTDTLTRLRRLPLVSVALVEGIGAVGGGAELATACDFRIMESDATFRFVQVQMGVSPGWGGGARLAGIAGRRAALRLLAWAAPLSAADAVAAGVADVVCPPGGAEEAAASFLEGILRQPSFRAVRAVKAAVASADDVSVEARRAEARAFRETWGAPANRQSLERSSGGTRRGAGAEKI